MSSYLYFISEKQLYLSFVICYYNCNPFNKICLYKRVSTIPLKNIKYNPYKTKAKRGTILKINYKAEFELKKLSC